MDTLELKDVIKPASDGPNYTLVVRDSDGAVKYTCDEVYLVSYEVGAVHSVASMSDHNKAQDRVSWEMVLSGSVVLREYDPFAER